MTETRYANTSQRRLHADRGHGGSFLRGLLSGALIGTAAGVLFAPQIQAALQNRRRQLTDAAASAGDASAEKYREAKTRIGDAVDDLKQKGRGVYGKALSAVVRGAEEVKGHATEAQTELDRDRVFLAPRIVT